MFSAGHHYFFLLNLDGWFGVCQTFSIFIWLLYDYVNLKSSIICCLFFVDTYLSFDISVSLSTVSEESCGNVFVILLILLTIKSPVACVVLWIVSLERVLSAYVADCIADLLVELNTESFFCFSLWLITKVTFVLSYVSCDLELW